MWRMAEHGIGSTKGRITPAIGSASPRTPTHMTAQPNTSGFYGLGIAPKLLEALDRQKFTTPTPIQEKAIPIALEGKDLMGIAQTGTGKTIAFGIPMIQRLAQVKGRGLIILPTRELAIQVDEELVKIGKHIGLRTAVLIGGQSMSPQKQALARKPHVIIATPGRLIDHMEQRTVKLNDVSVLVLDEADRMLDMGFEPQIKRILQAVPKERQTLLFSATMPPEITNIANKYMSLPLRVEIARAGTATELVAQELFVVHKNDKLRLLEKLLNEYKGTVLVFSRTKHGAKKITLAVKRMGANAAEIHSNRSLAQRREALDGFKNGKYRVLVATDIAARGIDVKGIELVVNFDLPDAAEDYVHRIGRTGRAGHEGRAISFATPEQGSDVRAIERVIRIAIPRGTAGELPPARVGAPAGSDFDDYPRGGGRGGYGRSGGSRSSGSGRGSSSYGAGGRGARSGAAYGSSRSTYDRPGYSRPGEAASAQRSHVGGASTGRGGRSGGHGVSGYNRNNDRGSSASGGVLPSSWNKKRRPMQGGGHGNDRRYEDLGDFTPPTGGRTPRIHA
jgi:ATP-dependent RNA helicase RhlE